MKMIYTLLVSVLLVLSYAESALPADSYLEFMQQFYHFDDQQFEQVTCQVVVPEFATLRDQMKLLENKVAVKEDFDQFRLTYTKGKGLSFNLPSLEVSLLSEEGIRDRSKVEAGMRMMKNGAENVVMGVVQTLEGLFKEYERQDRNGIKNVKVAKNGSGTQISYEKEGAKITSICTDRHCKTSVVQPLAQIDSDDEYEKVDNKLVVKSSTSSIKQSQSTIHAQVTIEYQKVNGVLFPSTITANSEMVLPNMKQEGRLSILLKECRSN